MGKIEAIAEQVQQLSAEELAAFREWFAQYDADAWDRHLEDDVKTGKLDMLAKRALQDHADGRSTPL